MLKKVISGGQTGVDRLGLEVARDTGIETGGTAAKGFMTENGPDLSLKEFGLVECTKPGYPPRTQRNVIDSDGTVLFGNMTSAGSAETIRYCVVFRKPYIINPSSKDLATWIKENDIRTLNVAGNRKSKLSIERAWDIIGILQAVFSQPTVRGIKPEP